MLKPSVPSDLRSSHPLLKRTEGLNAAALGPPLRDFGGRWSQPQVPRERQTKQRCQQAVSHLMATALRPPNLPASMLLLIQTAGVYHGTKRCHSVLPDLSQHHPSPPSASPCPGAAYQGMDAPYWFARQA